MAASNIQETLKDSGCVSMEAVSGELQKIELQQQMLDRLSQTDAHFKHQQRGEPDLGPEEKFEIASKILNKNPVTFLSRFCKHLVEEDLKYFSDLRDDYEVNFYITQISDRLNTSKNKKTVRNRRYEAMKGLIEGGEYFSDKEMKWRDPYLYEQMIGQHLTDDEIQAEVDKSDLGFASILLSHLSQQEENRLYRNLRDAEEGQEEEEEEDSEEEDEAQEEDMQQNGCSTTGEEESKDKISEEEKVLLREEFLHIMQERFLSGEDKEYDYSTVDANTDYDSLQIREQDEEERYFDDEPELMEAETTGEG